VIPLKWSDFRRIVSFPGDATQVCATSLYGPIRYTVHGGQQVIMAQGGIIGGFEMQDYSLRHSDQLYRSVPFGSGPWTAPEEMVTRHNFPWMEDPAYMALHPEAFISALTVGNVVQVPGHPDFNEFIAIFGCCVNDPNCCTEWSARATPYGSCISPFPRFEAIMMASPDGLTGWHPVAPLFGKTSGNVIEDARFLGMTLTPEDYNLPPVGPTGFKGVDKCSIGVQLADGMWYGTADFWSSWGPKTLIWRAVINEKVLNRPQVYANRQWWDCAFGIMPPFINNDTSKVESDRIWVGNAFDCPTGTITIAPPTSPGKYMIALNKSRQVLVSFTNDCVNWTPAQSLTETLDRDIGNPQVYAEDDGSMTVLLDATECAGEVWGGRGVYEGNVKL